MVSWTQLTGPYTYKLPRWVPTHVTPDGTCSVGQSVIEARARTDLWTVPNSFKIKYQVLKCYNITPFMDPRTNTDTDTGTDTDTDTDTDPWTVHNVHETD